MLYQVPNLLYLYVLMIICHALNPILAHRLDRDQTVAYHRYDGHDSRNMSLCIAVAAILETLPDKSVDVQNTCYYYYFILTQSAYIHTNIHTEIPQTHNTDYEINVICIAAGQLVQYQFLCNKTIMRKHCLTA